MLRFQHWGSTLRFQHSPQIHWWEGFLVFGNFSFTTPLWDGSPFLTLLCLFLPFIFCPTSFWRQWAAFLGAWCPLPAFRICFVEFAQRSSVLSMNLWGRKWSPHPIPLPSSPVSSYLYSVGTWIEFVSHCYVKIVQILIILNWFTVLFSLIYASTCLYIHSINFWEFDIKTPTK